MSQPLRGAIVGFGFISGLGHTPAYLKRAEAKKDVQIVAVADLCEARREIARKALPGARIYPDYQSLLAAEAANLDFVDIATPPCDHAAIAHAAFDRGLHVLCEKPLTTTLESAREMLAHAKKAQRVIFPCHNYKHSPIAKGIKKVIDSGQLGKVRSLTLATYRNAHAKGVTEWNTHWRRTKRWSGGGIAMDHGSHTFYLTFDWLGAYPTAVTAKMATLDGQYDTEDNFSCVLTFPSGLATAHLTWTAGMRKVVYTVQGEKGGVLAEDDNLEVSVMEKTSGPDIAQGAVTWKFEKSSCASDWYDASHVGWFDSLFEQFKEAIAKGDFVGKEARESYLCIQLITTAYRSAAEGCRELPLATEVPV
ncbi:MAG: Gfo/Idh/MocA family oxidoreductase [Myxococcales bacterium]